jgi:hypothetical protein
LEQIGWFQGCIPDPNSVVPKFMAIPFSGGGSKKLAPNKEQNKHDHKRTDVMTNDFFSSSVSKYFM